MKINEIILNELHEYFDTNYYGSWINANNPKETIPVKFYHYEELGKYLRSKGIEANPEIWPFQHNWVRVVHGSTQITLEGMREDIKKIIPRTFAQLISFNQVIIDFKDTHTSIVYDMPKHRNELRELNTKREYNNNKD